MLRLGMLEVRKRKAITSRTVPYSLLGLVGNTKMAKAIYVLSRAVLSESKRML
jgi:hypothetical protein